METAASMAENIAACLRARVNGTDESGNTFQVALPEAEQKLSFSFNVWKKKDRIVIRALFPADETRHPMRAPVWFEPTMTVSIAKPAEQIAKDIQRRLLTDYPKALAEVLALRDARDATRMAKRARLAELAELVGVRLEEGNHQNEKFSMHGIGRQQKVEVHLLSNDVRIDASWISMDQAKRILSILVDH